MHFAAGSEPISEECISSALTKLGTHLFDCEHNDERTVLVWDFRGLKHLPSRAQVQFGLIHFKTLNCIEVLDSRVKAVAIMVGSPFARALIGGLVRLCSPPQPVKICADQTAVESFLDASL